MQNNKPWYFSKSILLNMFMGVLVALAPAIPAAKPLADLVQNNMMMVAAIWSVLGVFFRVVSKDKIQLGE